MLEVDNIVVRYSGLPVLQGVSLAVEQGQTIAVVGSNGAGKSTLLKGIMGSARVYEGSITFMGRDITAMPTEGRVRLGLIYVPEDRKLFKPLSVEENLMLGAYSVDDQAAKKRNLEYVYELFPRLAERRTQAAGSMSGGEQQMCAIGRGLMSDPKLLMLDEPSLGLAPKLVSEVFETVKKLRTEGRTVLLVEQNVREALTLSDFGYVLQTGRMVLEGGSDDILGSEMVGKAYLGM